MRYLAGRCQSPEDLADAAAATFLAVLVSSGNFDPTLGTPTSWLYGIARNEASLQRRSAYRRRQIASKLGSRRLLSDDDTERIAEMMDAERRVDGVLEILSTAPEGERLLVERIVSDDATPPMAARSLGISSGAGRVRLMRLRARIRAALADATPGAATSVPEHELRSSNE